MKRGVNISLETVPKEEQEALMAAVKYWNKKLYVKCVCSCTVQYAANLMQLTENIIYYEAFKVQYAVCSMQYSVFSMQYAVCSMSKSTNYQIGELLLTKTINLW